MPKLPENFEIITNPFYEVRAGHYYNNYDGDENLWYMVSQEGGLAGRTIMDCRKQYPRISFAEGVIFVGKNKPKNQFNFPPPPDGFKILPSEESIKYTLCKGDFFIYNEHKKWEQVSDWHGRKVKEISKGRNNFTVAIRENPIKIEEIKDLKYVLVKHLKHFYTNHKGEDYWNDLPLDYYGKTVGKFIDDNGKEYRLGRTPPRFESNKPFPYGW